MSRNVDSASFYKVRVKLQDHNTEPVRCVCVCLLRSFPAAKLYCFAVA